ncbi:MAG: 6-carboxytetrahydropterin synthase [Rhodobiaceae bacterium]|jgi:6-pyruvoyltetrahydropterin/6-carboxytetrahydropterin synthase|nr:6-carboxytetrahydropterin synthase [Rhodobiaceae bacterium]MBT5518965.1 6-carboxytetrahydropterin synthase [Rhodobiaceae bacterium]MBT7642866.1 6-carboxytetrahydropterin synthase [Rhodobiaceae bacterium]MDG2495713.1 6-carboxytetrahydropterin synthase [Alphaproteobacteria bacterium]
MKLSREFTFDAAHSLGHYPAGHANTRVHGHSFRARVTVEGLPDDHGQIVDLEKMGAALKDMQARLDHQMLNEIEGLHQPTLENLCLWIWENLRQPLPQICAVEVFRDSLGQSCLYQGSQHVD